MKHGIFLCLGVSQSQMKKISISYIIGKLAFVDPPRIYDKGSNLEGKVSKNTVMEKRYFTNRFLVFLVFVRLE